jgi:hypothetical protein
MLMANTPLSDRPIGELEKNPGQPYFSPAHSLQPLTTYSGSGSHRISERTKSVRRRAVALV